MGQVDLSPQNFYTLDDIDLTGKRVLVRVDYNSPINPFTGELLSDFRIKATINTLLDLSEAAVVLISHQSRPGKEDFISLYPHFEKLREFLLGREVRFIPDVIGPTALREIERLKKGEILLLDNVRFLSEEMLDEKPERLSETNFVRRLSKHFDFFVNDAFACVHRAHSSMVAFPYKLPSVIGRLMERELSVVNQMLYGLSGTRVLILGGAKPKDRVNVIDYMLSHGRNNYFLLLGGILGKIFLAAKARNLPKGIRTEVEKYPEEINKAKTIVKKYGDRIMVPDDFALKKGNERVEMDLKEIEDQTPLDIGSKTVERYSDMIKQADLVFINGPLGLIEDPIFMKGTSQILRAIIGSKCVKIAGGGHISAIVEIEGLMNKFDHVSTGGGSMLYLLSGKKPLSLEVLQRDVQRKLHPKCFRRSTS